MNDLPPHLIPNRMTVEEYDRRHAELDATYGRDRQEAGIRREQEMARLFYRSGWTQERLAEKEGVSKSQMSRLVVFGRFLDFSPQGEMANIPTKQITEKRFRTFWDQTDSITGNERKRFQQVINLMQGDTLIEKADAGDLARKVIEEYGDGKPHQFATVVDFLGEDEKVCAAVIDKIAKNKSLKCKVERKPFGASFKFTIFRQHEAVSVVELVEKLTPLIDQLFEEGKKGPARIQGTQVTYLAATLKKLLDEWKAE